MGTLERDVRHVQWCIHLYVYGALDGSEWLFFLQAMEGARPGKKKPHFIQDGSAIVLEQ